MSVSYYNAHSVTFIKGGGSGSTPGSYKRSWYDFKMIPAKNPSVSPATPNTKIVTIPGMNGGLDLTSYVPGGLTFSRRTGQWDFYVDVSKWSSWSVAKRTIEDYLNGQFCYVVLEDDYSNCWAGRLAVTGWSNESDYPKITISYDFEYAIRTNTFNYNRNLTLTGISSSLMPGHNTYYVGDPIDSVRKWIITTAIYDNDSANLVRELVDIDSLGSSVFTSTGSKSIATTYKGKTSSVSVNVVAVAIASILSKLPNRNIFYLGDPKDIIRPFVETIATYNNGKTEEVTVESFGTDPLDTLGAQSLTTTYQGKTSSINFIVTEGKAIALEGVLKSSNNKYVWLGASKDEVKNLYNFYKRYSNNYLSTKYKQTIDDVDGIFDKLGDDAATVSKDGLYTSVDVFARKVVSLELYYLTVGIPAYMRIGDKIGRLKNYIIANGRLNDDRSISYSSSDLTAVDGASRFDTIGISSVQFSASNKAIGEYNENVIGSVNIEVKKGFDVIDSWEEINRSIQDGSYRTKYKVGDLAWITIGDAYNGYAQIVGIDTDIDEDGDTIPITWMLKETLYDTIKFDAGSHRSYITSSVKTYVDSLEAYFPNLLKTMLISSSKEYRYYDENDTTGGHISGSAYLKLWLPSCYEITADDDPGHDKNYFSADYTTFYNNQTERIKFINRYDEPIDGISWITPSQWLTRNCYPLYSTISTIKYIDAFGLPKTGYRDQNYRITIGFCTGATEYDENPDWMLRKFRKVYSTLEVYDWDDFGLDDTSDRNTVWDAVDAELNTHVANTIPASGLVNPAVAFQLTSETSTNYVYHVILYDDATTSDFVTKFKTRFNLTQNSVTQNGSTYVIDCTMTTNKLTIE